MNNRVPESASLSGVAILTIILAETLASMIGSIVALPRIQYFLFFDPPIRISLGIAGAAIAFLGIMAMAYQFAIRVKPTAACVGFVWPALFVGYIYVAYILPIRGDEYILAARMPALSFYGLLPLVFAACLSWMLTVNRADKREAD